MPPKTPPGSPTKPRSAEQDLSDMELSDGEDVPNSPAVRIDYVALLGAERPKTPNNMDHFGFQQKWGPLYLNDFWQSAARHAAAMTVAYEPRVPYQEQVEILKTELDKYNAMCHNMRLERMADKERIRQLEKSNAEKDLEISRLQGTFMSLNLWSKDIIDGFQAPAHVPATSTAQDSPTSSTNAGEQGSEQRVQAGQKRRHQSSSISN